MKPSTKLLSAGAALVALTAVAATGVTLAPDAGAQDAQVTKAAMFGGHHGWGRHGGRGFGRLCSEHRGERIERMLGFVETFMTFTPEQQQAWDQLRTSVREGDAMVGETCEQQKAEGDEAKSAPERLARMEAFMATGLDVMQKVRPAFNGFYATLNADQQKALDELMQHRRHHRRGDKSQKN